MKILLATFWIVPHVGGVWNYISQLKKKLESLGNEVDILGYGEKYQYVYIVNEFRKVERSQLLPLVNESLATDPLRAIPSDPIVKHCELERRIYELGAAYLGLEKYDVIHTQDVLSTACINLLNVKGPALVTTLHGCVAHEMRRQLSSSQTSEEVRRYFDELEYTGTVSAEWTIVANEWLKKILTDEFKVPAEKLRVYHYGYNVEDFLRQMNEKPAVQLFKPVVRPKDKKVILYTGRLVQLKGVHHLIEALSLLKKVRQDWVCWIVGEGEKRLELEAQSRILGIEGDLIFLEKRDDIPQLLASSDIFVLPSLIENQPLSVIEAQIAGKAVIVSDAGGLPEMVRHQVTGLISRIGDEAELCQHIDSLLKDDAYRQKLGNQAREWAFHHWSLEEGVKKVLEVYKDAVEKKRAEAAE
ncbi:glycosyltransferase family 4 protein [Heyndrickxia acidicola]|uniref:Glycosyltransferase family 4 protein n=1 Tax=Heyndrickxia acidicola TaxID=209389 RepID=A0ABU6MFK8_9BACI|nr:glycosyltransferase family 4 protein [Heyndrickxia acidicola]MED1203456.1 glycosyltransferase family 4 protein [Heyndrickxia acidicola]